MRAKATGGEAWRGRTLARVQAAHGRKETAPTGGAHLSAAEKREARTGLEKGVWAGFWPGQETGCGLGCGEKKGKRKGFKGLLGSEITGWLKSAQVRLGLLG